MIFRYRVAAAIICLNVEPCPVFGWLDIGFQLPRPCYSRGCTVRGPGAPGLRGRHCATARLRPLTEPGTGCCQFCWATANRPIAPPASSWRALRPCCCNTIRLIALHLHFARGKGLLSHYHFAALLITLQPTRKFLLCAVLGPGCFGHLTGGAGLTACLVRRRPVPPRSAGPPIPRYF